MFDLPKVLIGGHPNSGTSFLCNLVAEMGFSPGSPANLKGADDHNRWGYWEHEPLKEIVRAAAGVDRGTFWWIDELAGKVVLERGHPATERVRKIAEGDNVEIFKEGYLPLVYRLFPETCKAVVTRRGGRALYERRGAKRRGLSMMDFGRALRHYYYLVERMEIPVLAVRYEDFYSYFDEEVGRIAAFLDVDVDCEKLRGLFRPRTQ